MEPLLTSSNSILVGLQIFGTIFFVLLSFLGMTAWIVRRIDKVSESVDRVDDKVADMSTRLGRVEGKVDMVNGVKHLC